MAWWELEMWAEMLLEEFGEEDTPEVAGPDLRDVSRDVPGTQIATSLDDLAGFGMNVRQVG